MKEQTFYLATLFLFFFSFKGYQTNNTDSGYEKFLSEELRRHPQITLAKINEIKSRVEAADDLPVLNSRDYIIFLRSANYDVDKAHKMLVQNFRIRSELPELYNAEHPTYEESAMIYKITSYSINDNYLYTNVEITDLKQYNFGNCAKYLYFQTHNLLSKYGTFESMVIVMDYKGIGIKHVRCKTCKFPILTKIMAFMQDAPIIQAQAIHIVNAGWLVRWAYKLIRPWMNPEFVNKIQIHKGKSKNFFAYAPGDPRYNVMKKLDT